MKIEHACACYAVESVVSWNMTNTKVIDVYVTILQLKGFSK